MDTTEQQAPTTVQSSPEERRMTRQLEAVAGMKMPQGLTASDFSGLGVDSIQMLLGAQQVGNQQVQTALTGLMTDIRDTRQAMQTAKTERERNIAAMALEQYKTRAKMAAEEIKADRNLQNDITTETYKNQARMQLEAFKSELGGPTEGDIKEQNARIAKLEREAKDPLDGLDANQQRLGAQWDQDFAMDKDKWFADTKAKMHNPEWPIELRKSLADLYNQKAEATSYMSYVPEDAPWLGRNTPETIEETPLPVNPSTGQPITMGKVRQMVVQANQKRMAAGKPPILVEDLVQALVQRAQAGGE